MTRSPPVDNISGVNDPPLKNFEERRQMLNISATKNNLPKARHVLSVNMSVNHLSYLRSFPDQPNWSLYPFMFPTAWSHTIRRYQHANIWSIWSRDKRIDIQDYRSLAAWSVLLILKPLVSVACLVYNSWLTCLANENIPFG